MNLRVSGGGRKRAEEREGEEGGEEGEEEEGGMGMVAQCILTGRGRITDFRSTNPLERGGESCENCTCTRGWQQGHVLTWKTRVVCWSVLL